MPWISGTSQRLTDAQLWAIVCADPAVTNRQLADALGLLRQQVNGARWRLRRCGWSCPVSSTICQHHRRALTQQDRWLRRL